MGRRSVETIYINYGQDGEVLADIPPSANVLLMDSVSYGLALRRTTEALGIRQQNSICGHMMLVGDTGDIGARVLDLVVHAEDIARTSSYEQIQYTSHIAKESRAGIHAALAGIVDELPQVAESGELIDACAVVIGSFARVLGEEGSLETVTRTQAPWRLTPEERLAVS